MLGFVLLTVYLVLGVMMAAYLMPEKRPAVRIWAGGVLGIVSLMWSNVPFSFIFGFGVASHLCGLALTFVIAFALYFYRAKADKLSLNPASEKIAVRLFGDFSKGFTRSDGLMMLVILPFMIYGVTVILNHSFYNVDGNLYTGQCTYGDMNFHLGIITSIKEQGTFPPDYSICPGNQLNYYFLCDSVSSSLYLFGMSLRAAYMVPMFFAFLFVFAGFWFLAESALKSFSKAAIAFLLFFLNGGFGTFYFLDNLKNDPKNFTQIFTEYYHTPTNFVNSQGGTTNICWTNTIVDMMLPQRATLFGWMILFLGLYLLYNSVFESRENPKERHFFAAGVIAGLMPMIQTYSYFTIGLVAIAWIVYSCIRDRFRRPVIRSWLLFGIPALALSLPQLKIWIFGAVGGKSFISFDFNAYNASDNWLWFWVKNVGVVFILLIPAFISAPKKLKLMFTAGLLIFHVTDFVRFQTFAYDNNKLYLMWYVFAVIIVADLMVETYRKMKGIKGRAVIAAIVMILATNAALLTMGRELYSGFRPQSYCLYDARGVRAAEFVENNTPADSMFICYDNHNNVIASLTGRNIFVGAGTFLYSHDVNYGERHNALYSIFNSEEDFERYRQEYGFDYAYISEYERYNLDKGSFIESYLDSRYRLVYDADNIKIFDLNDPLS